ncbi:putative ribonuclease H-like domain-containing protein [Tanacetum coccineum]
MSADEPRVFLFSFFRFRPISTSAVFRCLSDSSSSKYGNATCSNGSYRIYAKLLDEQTQPEYLQELLQSLLKDLQILNEIQPLKQDISNQIQKDQRKKIEDMSIEEMMHEQQLVDREIKEIINDLGYKRFRGEEIDEEYERDCEIRIQKLKQDFNIWGSEVRKKEKAYEDEKYAAACRYMLSVTCDDDDDDNLGFYAGDGHINTTPETETISVETLVSNPSESDDFSLGELILFDIDDSYYEKSTKEADVLSYLFDNSITRGIESDHDSGEDTTSIDDLPLANIFHKSHSLVKMTIYQRTAPKNSDFKEKDNTAKGNPQYALLNQGIFDSGCSRHMAGNKSYLTDYQDIDGGFELKFNLLSVSQMRDKKISVLFTKTECLVLSPDFKILDESQVLLKVPRQNNMYNFDLKNVVPSGGLTCFFAKATIDESNLWHRRLGHINFKTMNKLMRGNLVRGLPLKLYENDNSCVACQMGKQHKASCKTKLVSSISHPLQMLHMDLFGPTFVRSINYKIYCLVVTDDYSRFSWVFFWPLRIRLVGSLTFITGIENQINHKVKIIRCDNGTKFKNNGMNQFCGMKGIKRKFSVARCNTPKLGRSGIRVRGVLLQ